MRKLIEVTCQCDSCSGTGLYSGFAEPKGVAVVCAGCNGTGYQQLQVTPFTGRKKMKGIKAVMRSRGCFLATGVGPVGGTTMTYAEFEKKYPVPSLEDLK